MHEYIFYIAKLISSQECAQIELRRSHAQSTRLFDVVVVLAHPYIPLDAISRIYILFVCVCVVFGVYVFSIYA